MIVFLAFPRPQNILGTIFLRLQLTLLHASILLCSYYLLLSQLPAEC